VDPKNTKSLETARNWGTCYNWDDTGRTIIEPDELLLDNKDFGIELYSAAGHSSQSGKLSFWSCVIERDNRKFLIGINSELLLLLLRQSTCINGRIQEKVMFARNGSNVGVLHTGMMEYQQALNDIEIKKKMSKKTGKHVIGQSYATLTREDIYLGDVYKWFKVQEIEGKRGWNYRTDTKYKYTLLDKPIKKHIFIDTYHLQSFINSIKTVSELFGYLSNEIDAYINEVDTGDLEYGQYPFIDKAKVVRKYSIVDKLPSRTPGKITLVNDYTTGYDDLINKVRQEFMRHRDKNEANHNYFLDIFGHSGDINKKPVYTEQEQERIMQMLSENIIVDFGNGVEYIGKVK
jgi:hypothetical protein